MPVAATTQVLQSLQKTAESGTPEPFPLHAKYVPAVRAKAGDQGQAGDGELDDDQKSEASEKPRGKPKTKAKGKKHNSDWQYSQIRSLFITSQRSKGFSYKDAVKIWDDSTEKAQILSLVPLPELKKRRFLERGVQSNPWLEKLGHST